MKKKTRRITFLSLTSLLVIVILASLLGACQVSYLTQAVAGHFRIMTSRKPIEKVLASDTLTKDQRDKLQMIVDVRRFAVDELGLPDNRSYTVMAQIQGAYPGYNVFCTPEFSVHPKTWCYPIAGCVVYHGYFKKPAAIRFAEKMKKEGLDVYVSPFTAYSTLGWFRDPILNTQLRYDSVYLAGLIFHELAHQRFYKSGDSQFSESFAVTVEHNGVIRWLTSIGRNDLKDQARKEWEQEDQTTSLMLETRNELDSLYRSGRDSAFMSSRKDSILAGLARDLGITGRKINNAWLVPVSTYNTLVPHFQHLLDSCNGDFRKFYAAVEHEAKKPGSRQHTTDSPQTATDALRSRSTAILHTLQSWYDDSTGQWKTTNWWNAANALTAVIDYSRITGSKDYLGVIENTFEKCREFKVVMEDTTKNWTCRNFINDYYDDEGWWVLAWIDAYDLTGTKKYLDMARTTFDDMANGWDEVCGGGIYWKKPDIAKSAVQNELFILCAIRLYERSSGNARGISYLDWARKTWDWFRQTGMINPDFQVENGLDKDCKLDAGRRYTYNQGVILSALIELGKAVGDPEMLGIAEKIAHAAIERSVYPGGILKDPNEPRLGNDGPQFKGIFMRHLAYLYSVTHKREFKEFILKIAEAIWSQARNPSNDEIGGVWNGPFDSGDAARQSSALDAFNAAMSVSLDR